jgi:tRNA(fMet)-specific endonuclease VapC
MLRYLLDTNTCIYVIKRRPPALLSLFNQFEGQMAISSITLAQLLHGAEKSELRDRNLRVVEDFGSRLSVLPYAEQEAAHYGAIRSELERAGQPIGVNDLHIAAHARSRAHTLVTNNLREFERVRGLLLENWVAT